MVKELYATLIAGLATFVGGFVVWFFRRRSETADAVNKEIDNDIKFADYYKSMLDDLSSRYEQKFKEVTELFELKIKTLNSEISFLKKENAVLRKRIKELEN